MYDDVMAELRGIFENESLSMHDLAIADSDLGCEYCSPGLEEFKTRCDITGLDSLQQKFSYTKVSM